MYHFKYSSKSRPNLDQHTSARIVIKRCSSLLKMQWGILRSPSFYPINTQCRTITVCCLLHNLIRREMFVDPLKHELNEIQNDEHDDEDGDTIATTE